MLVVRMIKAIRIMTKTWIIRINQAMTMLIRTIVTRIIKIRVIAMFKVITMLIRAVVVRVIMDII